MKVSKAVIAEESAPTYEAHVKIRCDNAVFDKEKGTASWSGAT